jgi:PAS domain S-box-containing protein
MTVKFQPISPAIVTSQCQKLLERISYPAWLMTNQAQIVAVNQQWSEYLGQCDGAQMPGDKLPQVLPDFLHTEDIDNFLTSWAEAKKLQKTLEIELRLKSTSGAWQWFQVKAEPDSDQNSQITWIATAMRLGSEAAIAPGQQSSRFLAALLDYASDGIVACDADGRLVLFNRTAQAFHGLPPRPIDPEEWANYYDLYDAEGLKLLTKSEIPLFQALAGKSVVSQEMMIKPKQSEARSLLASGAAIYGSAGEKLGAVVLMHDITEYKQAMTALQQSEQNSDRLSTALQVGRAGAWLWDLSTQQMFWTKEFEILLDYEPGSTQQIYSEWLERLHPDDREHAETALQNTIDRTSKEYRCEYRIIDRNSQIRWIDAIGELHYDEQGNLQMSGLIQDITDRKQLELLNLKQTVDLQHLSRSLILTQDRLKERNQELDSFVYMVSHDLKAPLRAIANLSTWIEEDLNEQIALASQQQFLLLRQRIYRMDALIDGLLRYSQVGRQALESEVVDVGQLLSEIIDSLAPPKNFKIKFLSPLPTLVTKRILLSQVFANLLSNAIKHHDRTEGQIEIAVVSLADCYQFSIADDGPGIPAGADQERIFEMFQTLKPNSTKENTGIGLALVKKIIEGEGGRIWLDNQQNSGTCFCFTWAHNNNLESRS